MNVITNFKLLEALKAYNEVVTAICVPHFALEIGSMCFLIIAEAKFPLITLATGCRGSHIRVLGVC
jgi:hypothetical protein